MIIHVIMYKSLQTQQWMMKFTPQHPEVQVSPMSRRDRPNDLLAPSQRDNRVHRGVTVNQSHMCVQCARNRRLLATSKSFQTLQRGVFNLDDYEDGYDAQYCLSADDDG
uniref:Uncharacterized protein n=1 Tax=Peronospora matthiolae TaxID=2874970 RepID=A0AAV1VH88_9STRA